MPLISLNLIILRSGEHHKLCCHSLCNYLHALITTPAPMHFPHKFVPKHCQRSCFLVRKQVFTPTKNIRYYTRYKNLFISDIHIVFTNLSIIYLKFCKVTKAQNINAYFIINAIQQKKKNGTFVEVAILLFTLIFHTYGKTFSYPLTFLLLPT